MIALLAAALSAKQGGQRAIQRASGRSHLQQLYGIGSRPPEMDSTVLPRRPGQNWLQLLVSDVLWALAYVLLLQPMCMSLDFSLGIYSQFWLACAAFCDYHRCLGPALCTCSWHLHLPTMALLCVLCAGRMRQMQQ